MEALDRVNRYGSNHLKGYCGNIWIQRDQPRRTMLGRSTVAGMGLYAAQSIKKDDFIGEYKGEIITSDEADRRGKIYDVRGVSFLFNLNKSTTTTLPSPLAPSHSLTSTYRSCYRCYARRQ